MKKMRKLLATSCLLAFSMTIVSTFTACSDDDGPKKPSKVITKIDVFKDNGNGYETCARHLFTYGKGNKITNVRSSYNNIKEEEVSYTYGNNSIEYKWETVSEDTTIIVRFESSLDQGRIKIGKSTIGNFVYFYDTPKGYVSKASIGADKSLAYHWDKNYLTIEGDPITYETTYGYSTIKNEYSIDLSILTQLTDSRKNFTLIMNTFGQLAGVLGTRYPNFLEDTDYTYTYQFDENNRLVQIEQTPSTTLPGKQDTYWYRLTYED